MKRRSIVVDCLAALPLAESIASGSAALPDERLPNIIFILLDDQGWADGSSLGHPYMKTGIPIGKEKGRVRRPCGRPLRNAAKVLGLLQAPV